MTACWIVILLMVGFQLIPTQTEKGAKWKLFASLFALFVYGAIRTDYGLDYQVYLDAFREIKSNLLDNERIEFGYILLNKLAPSFRILIVILTAFTCYTYFWFFDRVIPEKYRWLGFLLLGLAAQNLIFFQFSGLRNAIAVNLLVLGFFNIRDKQYIRFLILFLIACCFHTSALIFFPVAMLIGSMKITKTNIFILATVCISLVVLASNVIDVASGLIITHLDKYTSYLELVGDNSSVSLLTLSFAAIQLTLLLYTLYKEDLSPTGATILRLSLIYLMGALVVYNFRITQYFAIFYMAMPIVLLSESRNKLIKAAIMASTLVYLAYAYNIYIHGEFFSYQDYTTIFD